MPLALPILTLTIYFLPGFIFSRLFRGQARNNLAIILFISFIVTPFLYVFLIYVKSVTLLAFLSLNLVLFLVLKLVKPHQQIDFDAILPQLNPPKLIILLIIIFWLLNTLPRLGLIQDQYPIGDDMHRIGKTISIAESPNQSLFYHFPTTRLTIYYYVAVGSGLLVRFSQNQITANQAWFIHVSLWSLSMVLFLSLAAENLFQKLLPKLIFTASLTFFAGYEFFIAILKNANFRASGYWTDLEWWTDWFDRVFNIHFQISAPYTLFFWVPQHLFAGLLSLFLFFLIRSEIKKRVWTQITIGLVLASIFGYSAFVFSTVIVTFFFFQLAEIGRKLSGTDYLKGNLVIALTFLVSSLDPLILYITAEKGSWFSLRLNAFWFWENTGILSKLGNLLATIPVLFLIELGGLSVILVYTLKRLVAGEKEKDLYFWHLNIFLPLTLMFFIRAADDNNISLRSTIPSLIGLAIFAGQYFETETKVGWRQCITIFLLLMGTTTTLTMFMHRFREQWLYGQQNLKPIYRLIDQKTPLKSIVITDEKDQSGNISILAHRFTFKPIREFNVTDKEYSAFSKIRPYENRNFSSLSETKDFVREIKKDYSFLQDYNFYFLTQKTLEEKLFDKSGDYNLYSL